MYQKPPENDNQSGNNITFAPVIKINTKDIDDVDTHNVATIEEPEIENVIETEPSTNLTIKPKDSKDTSGDDKTAKPLDFNNLIIKKV
jgi:hypothetical protein